MIELHVAAVITVATIGTDQIQPQRGHSFN
jgi:hypothetical protein